MALYAEEFMLGDIVITDLTVVQLRKLLKIPTPDPKNLDLSSLRWTAMGIRFGSLDTATKSQIWKWYLEVNSHKLNPLPLVTAPTSLPSLQNFNLWKHVAWLLEPVTLPLLGKQMKYQKVEFPLFLKREQASTLSLWRDNREGYFRKLNQPEILLQFWDSQSGLEALPLGLIIKVDGRAVKFSPNKKIFITGLVRFNPEPTECSTLTLVWIDEGKG